MHDGYVPMLSIACSLLARRLQNSLLSHLVLFNQKPCKTVCYRILFYSIKSLVGRARGVLTARGTRRESVHALVGGIHAANGSAIGEGTPPDVS
ncbi:hypothetical protein [Xanthomonas prunicola]|uniref:hypothetical protein n=1 Tax=Xanthomonas prunicola TaxID=2053930 RepID=UPI0010556EDA|nr:hypothetical protein [Xanthomonas prunicola]